MNDITMENKDLLNYLLECLNLARKDLAKHKTLFYKFREEGVALGFKMRDDGKAFLIYQEEVFKRNPEDLKKTLIGLLLSYQFLASDFVELKSALEYCLKTGGKDCFDFIMNNKPSTKNETMQ